MPRRASVPLPVMTTTLLCVLAGAGEIRSQPLPAPALRLEPVWRVPVGGPARARTLYRLAVCRDGSAYFTDSGGRIVHLGSNGETALDAEVPAARGVLAAACRANGDLAVATPGALVWFTRAEGRLAVERQTATTVVQLAATDDALVGLGLEAGTRRVIRRFPDEAGGPEEIETLVVLERVTEPSSLSDEHLFWDGHRSRIGLVHGRRYKVHSFDRDGRLLGCEIRADPSLQTAAPADPLSRCAWDDYVSPHVVAIHPWGGQFLAFVVSATGHALEVVDGALRLSGLVENVDEWGLPAGVASDGDVLFLAVTPRGSWVTRGRLIAAGGD